MREKENKMIDLVRTLLRAKQWISGNTALSKWWHQVVSPRHSAQFGHKLIFTRTTSLLEMPRAVKEIAKCMLPAFVTMRHTQYLCQALWNQRTRKNSSAPFASGTMHLMIGWVVITTKNTWPPKIISEMLMPSASEPPQ
jgi:hypothetical protein